MKLLAFNLLLLQLLASNFAWAVDIVDVGAKPWPTSAVTKFATRVCSEKLSDVEEYLKANQLPYKAELVRKSNQSHCHIIYEATAKGFRAKPDIGPVKSLLFNLSALPIEFQRQRIWGDSFDIWRFVKEKVPQVSQIVIVDQPMLDQTFIDFKTEIIGWPQDYLVSGYTSAHDSFILVPHKIYEGDLSKGDRFAPFLDEIQTKIGIKNQRSKFSWEGGDFVVLSIPNSRKTLLVYGSTITSYWAADLSRAEIEFVLKTEFGVDEVLDGTSLSAHVDYTVLPIDEQRILFRDPFTGDRQFMCDLAKMALRDYAKNLNVKPVKLSAFEAAACDKTAQVNIGALANEAILEFEINRVSWVINGNLKKVETELMRVLMKNCGTSDRDCMLKLLHSVEGLKKVQAENPKLVVAQLDSLIDGISNTKRFQSYYDLLAGQLLKPNLARLDNVRNQLKALGFTIISVRSPYQETSWAGISYVNSLVVDGHLFIPSFGLTTSEAAIRNQIAQQLPDLKVHLVPALIQLSNNGGVHCSVKAIR